MSEMKKVTPKQAHETYTVWPRARNMIEKTGQNAINGAASVRIAELKSERLPDFEQEQALKTGKKVVKDAAGKTVKNADGKDQVADLTAAERTSYENARKTFAARRAEIEADLTAMKGAKFRFSGEFAPLLARYTDDCAEELIRFAFSVCKLKDKKIVCPEFFMGEGVENLLWYQLFSQTKTWRNLVATGDFTAPEDYSFKGSSGSALSKLFKEIMAPLVLDSTGSAIMEQKEKKKKDADGNEVSEFVYSAKRDMTGPYAQLRMARRSLKFLDDLFSDVYGIISAQLQLRAEGRGVKTITASDLTAVVRSILDMGLPIRQTITYNTEAVVDSATKKANAALPADQRKKESELPKVNVKVAKITPTVEGSRFGQVSERIRAWQTAYDSFANDKKASQKK